MRLSTEHRLAIREEVLNIFGPAAQVRLFGSRLNDDARGGDIDLFIETTATPDEALQRELTLHSRLIKKLGDQRIDIVIYRKGEPMRPIDLEAQRTGIVL